MNRERIAELVRQILVEIGEDPSREGLLATPERVAKSYEFLFQGYDKDPEAIINSARFSQENDNMIVVRDIEIYSMCEHHMLPFFGKCHVGYISKGKVLGVSKIARIVDLYARRLQIQENLTRQIAEEILSSIDAMGVGVVIEAQHLCMMMRGVEKQNSQMTTSCMLGIFRKNQSTRNEFLSLIRNK
ncbi:MAG: GTP cyclohydrolase I FolE [Abditibacteriota bacterium]|nr:GTP cyclohydrolase I FolE [Abditibacteriota bacterium]